MSDEKKLIEYHFLEAPVIKIKDSACEMEISPITNPLELKEMQDIKQKIETGEFKTIPFKEIVAQVNLRLKQAGKPEIISQ